MIYSKKALLLKIFKITGITFAILIALLVVIPMLFTNTFTEKVKALANETLEGEINLSA